MKSEGRFASTEPTKKGFRFPKFAIKNPREKIICVIMSALMFMGIYFVLTLARQGIVLVIGIEYVNTLADVIWNILFTGALFLNLISVIKEK